MTTLTLRCALAALRHLILEVTWALFRCGAEVVVIVNEITSEHFFFFFAVANSFDKCTDCLNDKQLDLLVRFFNLVCVWLGLTVFLVKQAIEACELVREKGSQFLLILLPKYWQSHI